MTTTTSWREGNDRYLAAALGWLRLRLEAVAAPAAEPEVTVTTEAALPVPAPVASATVVEVRGRRRWLGRRRAELSMGEPPLALEPAAPDAGRAADAGAPAEADASTDAGAPFDAGPPEDEEEAAERMARAADAMSPPPALDQLVGLFGLTRFERDVLLLCAAVEVDSRVPALCAEAHGEPWPSIGLAMRAFDDPEWSVLSPERPLRHWHLVEFGMRSATPLTASPLRADDRIVAVVKGMHHLDERLDGLARPVPAPARPLPPSQQRVVEAGAALLRRAAAGPEYRPTLQLVGPDPASRLRVAAALADAVGARLRRLPAGLLPDGPDTDLVARLWHREAVLTGAVLYLDTEDDGSAADAASSGRAVGRFLDRAGGAILLGGAEVDPRVAGTALLDVGRPTAAEQRAAWADALGTESDVESDVDLGALVAQFDLDDDTIRAVAARTAAPTEADPTTSEEDGAETPRPRGDRIWDACRRVSRPRLESLAQRVEPVASWDQLVLPEQETAQLHQIAHQVAQRGTVYGDWGFGARMNRGQGITALFAGDPGTGKSMAAEVLASHLRLDLYRIDLSGVVSKYIGETEKNLRRLFDAAEGGGVLLFFDEADALFGKRSEVRDSHDRYANLEVGYLLQRMEVYRGLAVLATNMRTALDRAFVRRLRFVVTFPFPSAAERERMWRLVFPPETPTGGLDPTRLARLGLTGAGIRDAAVNAAFLAAAEGAPVGLPHVLRAARAELRKLERPIPEADFRLLEEAAP